MSSIPSTLTICGLGNIGSQVVPAVSRLKEIQRLVLVDPDIYEAKNLTSQGIDLDAVSRPKAEVMAEQVKRHRPDLEVIPYQGRLEDLPWGTLRSEIYLGCLDTKLARRNLSRMACRMGGIYIDAGVDPFAGLVRVSVYPRNWVVCMECGWGRSDYANLEVEHSCQAKGQSGPGTNAPACLGQLAAGMQVFEVQKMLQGRDGQFHEPREAGEILLDAKSRRYYHSHYRPNPDCRFDHRIHKTEVLRESPESLRLGDLLNEGGALEAEGDAIVRDVVCPSCRTKQEVLRLKRRLTRENLTCESCEGDLQPFGFSMRERLRSEDLRSGEAERSFASAGFRAGDFFQLFCLSPITGAPEIQYYEFEGGLPPVT